MFAATIRSRRDMKRCPELGAAHRRKVEPRRQDANDRVGDSFQYDYLSQNIGALTVTVLPGLVAEHHPVWSTGKVFSGTKVATQERSYTRSEERRVGKE